jgi:hypothetical protein
MSVVASFNLSHLETTDTIDVGDCVFDGEGNAVGKIVEIDKFTGEIKVLVEDEDIIVNPKIQKVSIDFEYEGGK